MFGKKESLPWPKDPSGENEAPAFLCNLSGNDLSDEITVNMLEAYGIPCFRAYPGDGAFGKVVLGMSGEGTDIYVPESRLEEAKDLLSAEGGAEDAAEDEEDLEEPPELISEIITRRSIRRFTDDPVSDACVRAVVEAARLAPSGNNSQPWRFIVIRDGEKKKLIAKADHDQDWMLSAPVFIACMADLGCRVEGPFEDAVTEEDPSFALKKVIRDTAVAVGYMLLEAESLGLGTCWTGWYDQREMHEVLGCPNGFFITGILALGYPDEEPQARPRLPLDDILHYENW